jgi:hypothetical protein
MKACGGVKVSSIPTVDGNECSLRPLYTSPQEKDARFPLNKDIVKPQDRPDRYGEKNKSLPLPRNEM